MHMWRLEEEELTYRESYREACKWNARLLVACILLLAAIAYIGVLWWDAERMLQHHSPKRPVVWRKA